MNSVTIGNATLYLGDCREILPMLPSAACITDPPYGFGAYSSDRAEGITDALKPLASQLAVFGYPEQLVSFCMTIGIAPSEWIAWAPSNKTTRGGADRLPRAQECIAIWGRLKQMPLTARVYDKTCSALHKDRTAIGASDDVRLIGDVWTDPSPGMGFNSHQRVHPNEKPLVVMERLVSMMSAAGDTVIDPYMGSGTTGVACANLGRPFIGIEIDSEHFETAKKRIGAAHSQQRLFA